MLHRLSGPKPSDSGKPAPSPTVRRVSSDQTIRLSGSAQMQNQPFQMGNVVIPRQAHDAPNGAAGASRAASTVSAPVYPSENEFVQLSQAPGAPSFRSSSSTGTQNTNHTYSLPVLSAEETVERVPGKQGKHSHRSPSKAESPSKKKKKESKRENKEKRDSVKVLVRVFSDGVRSSEGEEDTEPRVGSSYRKTKPGSMRRRGSVRSDQGSRGETSTPGNSSTNRDSGAAGCEKNDPAGEEDIPRPLSRHASTLSTAQQSALARTPSFLSRTHTPPPKLLREMTMRRRRQVQATTANNMPSEDDEDVAGRRPSAHSPPPQAVSSPTGASSKVEIFHLSDVESLESSHVLTTPSVSSHRAAPLSGAGSHAFGASSLTTPSSSQSSVQQHGLAFNSPPRASTTTGTAKTAETEAKKIPLPGRSARSPSLKGVSGPTPLTTPASAAGASGSGPLAKDKPSTPVPAPPMRQPLTNATATHTAQPGTTTTTTGGGDGKPTVSAASNCNSSSTRNGTDAVSAPLSPIPKKDSTTDGSLNSMLNAFDRYVMAGSDSVNNSLVMTSSRSANAVTPSTSTTKATPLASKPSNGVSLVAASRSAPTIAPSAVSVGKSAAQPLSPSGAAAKASKTLVLAEPASVSSPMRPLAKVSRAPPTTATPKASVVATVKSTAPTAAPESFQRQQSSDSDASLLSPPPGSLDVSKEGAVVAVVASPSAAAARNRGAHSTTNHNNNNTSKQGVSVSTEPASTPSGPLQPAKRGAQNPIGSPPASQSSPVRTARQGGPAASKINSSGSSEDLDTSASGTPIMIQRRARQVQSLLDDDDDVFTSSSSAPKQQAVVNAMNLATPTASAAAAASAEKKRAGYAALQALGVNVSLDDDDGYELDDEEDEGLLDGFRPEGFAAKRGARRSSSITLFITQEDLEDSMMSNSASGRASALLGAGASKTGFSVYDVSMSNVQVGSSLGVGACGVPCPRVTVAPYVPTDTSALHGMPPALPSTGNPYLGDATTGAASQAKNGRRPTRGSAVRPSSRTSRSSVTAFDQSYGFGLEGSTVSLGSTSNGAGWRLPSAQPSIFVATSGKYKADPSKLHRPVANTFGRRRAGCVPGDDEDDEDDEEYDYEFEGEEGEEWYWEEVEEDEEDDEEEDDSDGETLIVSAPIRRAS